VFLFECVNATDIQAVSFQSGFASEFLIMVDESLIILFDESARCFFNGNRVEMGCFTIVSGFSGVESTGLVNVSPICARMTAGTDIVRNSKKINRITETLVEMQKYSSAMDSKEKLTISQK